MNASTDAGHRSPTLPQNLEDDFVYAMSTIGPAESEFAARVILWSFLGQTDALAKSRLSGSGSTEPQENAVSQAAETLSLLCALLRERSNLDGTFICTFETVLADGVTKRVSGYPVGLAPAHGGRDIKLAICPHSEEEYDIGWTDSTILPEGFDITWHDVRRIQNLEIMKAETAVEKHCRIESRERDWNHSSPCFTVEDAIHPIEKTWLFAIEDNQCNIDSPVNPSILEACTQEADELIRAYLCSQIEKVLAPRAYRVDIAPGPALFSLVAMAQGDIEIRYPEKTREAFENYLEKTLESYKTQDLETTTGRRANRSSEIDNFLPF